MPKSVSDEPNAPIDPLVALGEPQNTDVLAAKTQNIKTPKFSASDLGIKAKDISGTLSAKQLPFVLVPADSPLHFLVDIGTKLRFDANQLDNLKLKLAEANNLISRNKITEANIVLNDVNTTLPQVAKEANTIASPVLQTSVRQISETRFSILGSELGSSKGLSNREQVIKDIAIQAKNTVDNVKPYLTATSQATNLVQIPVVG